MSPFTYYEITHTNDPGKKDRLSNWFLEIWQHWVGLLEIQNDLPSLLDAERLRISLLTSTALDDLPDMQDRVLLIDAMVYRCDCFCTRDWTTILSKRAQLQGIGIPIVTPAEWWDLIKPFAGLWV